jgi:hypothetical protein
MFATRAEISAWENEGGARIPPGDDVHCQLLGTPSQIEWAKSIRVRVSAEFDRVAASLRMAARTHDEGKRREIEVVIAILEEIRGTVMSNSKAGYFVRDWQEITDQVRRLILSDSRYQAVKPGR